MFPLLTYPLMLLGLAALPALTAIYIYRQRHRRQVVSSLMLWRDIQVPSGGGDRLRRLEAPLLYFLELLALLLLVLAATNPQFFAAERSRPLVVVLDDSYSMLAGGSDSPRERALEAIAEELQRRPRPSVRFLLAGERPQLLGDAARTPAEAALVLKGWQCRSRSAQLDEALALAVEMGGEWALLLVITDKAPVAEMEQGRIQWWAFGEPRPNFAIVAASRAWRGAEEQVSLTVSNLAKEVASTALIVETGNPAMEIARKELNLAAGGETTVGLTLKEGTLSVRARLNEDALAIDNRVTLQPIPRRPVRVSLEIGDEALRRPVDKAIRAVRDVVLTGTRPDLVITDRQEAGEIPAEAWVVHLLAEKDAESWLGPFVMDRAHPLTQGLGLQGVIWASGRGKDLPGNPVVLAGAVPLLTETIGAARRVFRLRWRPELSTLQDTPAWPALFYNLVQYRASAKPELSRVNVRLGEEVVRTFGSDLEAATITEPDGQKRQVVPRDRRLSFHAEQAGVYEIDSVEGKDAIAVNALNRQESDLTECATGRWGDWLDESTLRLEYRGVATPLLLAAIAILTLHLAIAARRRGA